MIRVLVADAMRFAATAVFELAERVDPLVPDRDAYAPHSTGYGPEPTDPETRDEYRWDEERETRVDAAAADLRANGIVWAERTPDAIIDDEPPMGGGPIHQRVTFRFGGDEYVAHVDPSADATTEFPAVRMTGADRRDP